MVRKGGLEPPRLAALEPKSSASTNSATFAAAFAKRVIIADPGPDARETPPPARPCEDTYPFRRIASDFRVGRPLRKLSRCVAAPAAGAAPAVGAIYRFARTADDFADEGDCRPKSGWRCSIATSAHSTRSQRARLPPSRPFRNSPRPSRATRCRSRRSATCCPPSGRTCRRRAIPTFELVLDYCRRSANPVGRLMLRLYAAESPANLVASDAICTACSSSTSGRTSPSTGSADACTCRRGPRPLRRHRSAHRRRALRRAWRALIAFESARTRALLESGRPLARVLPWRIGWSCAASSPAAIAFSTASSAPEATSSATARSFARATGPALRATHCSLRAAIALRTRRHRMTPDQYCQEKAASSGSSFYNSFRFLPPEAPAPSPRCTPSAAKSTMSSTNAPIPSVARTKLAWWRREIARRFRRHAAAPGRPGAAARDPRLQAARGAVCRNHRRHGNGSEPEPLRRLQGAASSIATAWPAWWACLSAEIFGYSEAATPRSMRTISAWLSSSPTSSATSARMRGAAASTCRWTNCSNLASAKPISSAAAKAARASPPDDRPDRARAPIIAAPWLTCRPRTARRRCPG